MLWMFRGITLSSALGCSLHCSSMEGMQHDNTEGKPGIHPETIFQKKKMTSEPKLGDW